MLTSVFTPTHNTAWIFDTYRSLVAQTNTAWEWVIVPNGSAQIPDEISNDRRVRVCPAPSEIKKGVGALKRFACSQCRGDLFVELDHDDLLTSRAIESLASFAATGQAGFFYSDFVNFCPDGTSQLYSPEHGWETYPFHHEGHGYTATKSFAVCPRSLSEIYYSPNHVRAWTRDAYYRAGGYDDNLALADDHDLVCRTYLAGVEFCRIPTVLYLYREQNNTYKSNLDEIARLQQQNSNKYIYRIIQEWCRRQKLPMLDLGGRIGCPNGYTSVDLLDADIICDIASNGLSFPDSTVGCIRAADFLEHIPQHRVVYVMNEVYRALVPGGWFITKTPSTDGRGAFQAPDHVSYWNSNSFWYYTRTDQARYVPEIKCRFQAARLWNDFPNDWCRTHNIAYVNCDLVAIKGQRMPGRITI